MTLDVKQDEPLDPINVSSFGSLAVVPGKNGLSHLIEKFRFGCGRLSR
jgi:hypothetical protein